MHRLIAASLLCFAAAAQGQPPAGKVHADIQPLMELAQQFAAQGDAGAQAAVKVLSNAGNEAEARLFTQWLVEKARKGHAPAQFQLALQLESAAESRLDQAVEWYQRAVDQRYVLAYNNLAVLYLQGRGVAKNPQKAAELSRYAAERGNAAAATRLGTLYETGEGVPRDGAQALHWHEKAAALGSPGSHTSLFFMYARGEMVPKDLVKAAAYLNQAAELEEPIAMSMFLDNRAKVPVTVQSPSTVIRKAAESGDGAAQLALALRLQSGDKYIAKDEAAALRWLRRAASEGHAEAQAQLGYQYLMGIGVAKSDRDAIDWTRMAVKANNPMGLANMGAMHLMGNSMMRPDPKQAADFFRRAAALEHPRALQLVGEWTENGTLGFKRDVAAAKGYYRRAAKQGDAKAIAALKRLGE
ncbi:MAG: sel1 repeat family protein [Betaproteobacteria bacterium]|nr:sel1 repeat family protein [Betaproteobacteria bacterium]